MPFGMQLTEVLLNRFEQKQHVQLYPELHGGLEHGALEVDKGPVLNDVFYVHVIDPDEVDHAQAFVDVRPSTRSLLLDQKTRIKPPKPEKPHQD